MSKRRNRTGAPNLPPETLARARRQAGVPSTGPEEEAELVDSAGEVETEANEAPEPAPRPAAPAPRRTAEPRVTSAGMSRSASAAARRGRGVRPVTANGKREMDHNRIAAILEHPTRFVSDEELKQQYGYVIEELRQVGMVAAGLLVVLVVLAYLIPK